MAGDETRKNSFSGGVFSLLAEYALFDHDYICGAEWTDGYLNVKHAFISDLKELDKMH